MLFARDYYFPRRIYIKHTAIRPPYRWCWLNVNSSLYLSILIPLEENQEMTAICTTATGYLPTICNIRLSKASSKRTNRSFYVRASWREEEEREAMQSDSTLYSSRGGRRNFVLASTIGIGGVLSSACFVHSIGDGIAMATEFTDMPALKGKDYGKTKMKYPDYTETQSGLQFKDLRRGDGPPPKIGQTVVVDWDGYTIGYYGRIFEARNKTKGGSFEGDDKDFFKFTVGSNQVIPAFEEAIVGMSPGGIRRFLVPPELGYPDNDFNKLGPKPTTFSGQRALDFVLRNQGLIDKTLLFDIELIKVVQN